MCAINKDLTIGKPYTVVWKFCLPLFGSIIFQQLYNAVDGVVVGRFVGKEALAAVSASFFQYYFVISWVIGVGSGISVVISQFFGAKDYVRVQRAFSSFFIFMLGCAYALISDLRAGIWDRHLKANTKTNAAVSVVGGAAVFVWGLIKFAEFGVGASMLCAVFMGASIWVLCFALLQLSMKAYKKRHAELENPKEDDDENE